MVTAVLQLQSVNEPHQNQDNRGREREKLMFDVPQVTDVVFHGFSSDTYILTLLRIGGVILE